MNAYPQAAVRGHSGGGGELEFVFEKPTDDAARIKPELDQQLKLIEQYLAWQAADVADSNRQLEPTVRRAVVQRRARLLKQSKLSEMLGIPLRHNPEAPQVTPLPISRKLIRPLPTAPPRGFTPEPGIQAADYEHILSVIRHTGRTFEATPDTFRKLEEEELRNVLLANLNGHYQGDATGETFRRKGKTDIRIEDSNRAAFVAECKIWCGQKKMLEAIDQLLSYLTWRDCKASLILFNKDVAGFSALLEKLEDHLQAHEHHRSRLRTADAGEWRHRFLSMCDPSREVIIHTFMFNLRP